MDDGCALPRSDVILLLLSLLYKLKPITIRRLNRYAHTDLWALMRIRRRTPTAVGVRGRVGGHVGSTCPTE